MFGTKFRLSVILIQLLKFITLLGFNYVTVINCLSNIKYNGKRNE